MTKLDNYCFDKTECGTCQHNTLNQVLFQMCGDCAGCQNPTCLRAKNEAYLVDKCLDILTKDPRLHLACNDQSNANVVARLTDLGHEVLTLDMPLWRYDSEPRMPESPQAENFEDPDEFEFAKEDYETAMNRFKEKCVELEYAVSEGRKLKYAVITATSVDFYYETVINRIETADGQSWSVAQASPAKKLQDKDVRNHQICYEQTSRRSFAATPTVSPKRPSHPVKNSFSTMYSLTGYRVRTCKFWDTAAIRFRRNNGSKSPSNSRRSGKHRSSVWRSCVTAAT